MGHKVPVDLDQFRHKVPVDSVTKYPWIKWVFHRPPVNQNSHNEGASQSTRSTGSLGGVGSITGRRHKLPVILLLNLNQFFADWRLGIQEHHSSGISFQACFGILSLDVFHRF